jgi:hypothetical protein
VARKSRQFPLFFRAGSPMESRARGRDVVAEITALKYRAFLSYSHHDTWWAKWLHSGLETFRIDKDWVGRNTAVGLVPKTLRPHIP